MIKKLINYLKKVFELPHNERYYFKCKICGAIIDGATMDQVILHEIKFKHYKQWTKIPKTIT